MAFLLVMASSTASIVEPPEASNTLTLTPMCKQKASFVAHRSPYTANEYLGGEGIIIMSIITLISFILSYGFRRSVKRRRENEYEMRNFHLFLTSIFMIGNTFAFVAYILFIEHKFYCQSQVDWSSWKNEWLEGGIVGGSFELFHLLNWYLALLECIFNPDDNTAIWNQCVILALLKSPILLANRVHQVLIRKMKSDPDSTQELDDLAERGQTDQRDVYTAASVATPRASKFSRASTQEFSPGTGRDDDLTTPPPAYRRPPSYYADNSNSTSGAAQSYLERARLSAPTREGPRAQPSQTVTPQFDFGFEQLERDLEDLENIIERDHGTIGSASP